MTEAEPIARPNYRILSSLPKTISHDMKRAACKTNLKEQQEERPK